MVQDVLYTTPSAAASDIDLDDILTNFEEVFNGE